MYTISVLLIIVALCLAVTFVCHSVMLIMIGEVWRKHEGDASMTTLASFDFAKGGMFILLAVSCLGLVAVSAIMMSMKSKE